MAQRPGSRAARRTAAATASLAVLFTSALGVAGARPVGAFDVGGAIEVEYDQAGGPAVLGDPTGPELDAASGGRFQTFANNAAIYWRGDVGAHQVGGPIRDKWGQLGWERGALGYPVTRETATPGDTGRFNHFQGGSIYWSVGTAAHQVGGAIRDKWGRLGWESGPLGFPVTDESTSADNGRYNLFNGGAIYYSPRTGAHAVWGVIRDRWIAAGAENGQYGYPTSDEYDYEDGKAQDFEGGRITWTP
ncbi:hypothetical protein IU443_04420 [Nocardia farcinica]|uniref:LGFP repeat n=1 Tax=Nocardia farcinica TaxID=37329 RepID=A0A449HCN9_NOCFR|nr:hypothetical protein [Nocardia farcinica]MBF6255766.1 hypothetical protein [Nocardia farcinica]MBF6261135.1 hypothetical protein [Nocardia farcinica]MBF6267507.1 hypothetical protein [Nocardia farcinica]MBF6279197.1 hypothetical protein [Nocardia farcinica]MBF6304145.1 hypothetical protein [Nocardia farcinica]